MSPSFSLDYTIRRKNDELPALPTLSLTTKHSDDDIRLSFSHAFCPLMVPAVTGRGTNRLGAKTDET